MNKDQLIRKVAENVGKQNKEVKLIIEDAFDSIIKTIASGEKVQIVGFGTFETRTREERVGRNPQTGETITLERTKTPAFKPGKKLRDIVKGRI